MCPYAEAERCSLSIIENADFDCERMQNGFLCPLCVVYSPLRMRTTANLALARAVRWRRKSLRLSQDELALLAGCSRPFVSEVERGKPTVQLDRLLSLLAALGLGFRLTESVEPLSVEAALEAD
jgi:HTH-type transcriptional regulator / antitoxin HipB